MKIPDESTYYFMELFQDKHAIEAHSESAGAAILDTLADAFCSSCLGTQYLFTFCLVQFTQLAFKDMQRRLAAAKANDRSRKARFDTGMKVCVSTTRRVVAAHSIGAKI
eukprot:SAG31_NODE_1183_length_9510_cov_43.257040_7_plen_109_part_00